MSNQKMRVYEINPKTLKAGIYAYRDLKDEGKIVYIGKDSNLLKSRRHYDHMRADFKEGKRGQHVNKILQENPKRYLFTHVLYCEEEWIDMIEQKLIEDLQPQLNIIGIEEDKDGD